MLSPPCSPAYGTIDQDHPASNLSLWNSPSTPARGTPLGQVPLPDEPDFVVFGGADALEAEFVQDVRRGIFRRKRLRSHSDSRYLGASDIHQRLGHLSCEPLALVLGEGEIRDFDPVFARGTFKRAGADATSLVDDQVRDPGWVEAATPVHRSIRRQDLPRQWGVRNRFRTPHCRGRSWRRMLLCTGVAASTHPGSRTWSSTKDVASAPARLKVPRAKTGSKSRISPSPSTRARGSQLKWPRRWWISLAPRYLESL